MSKEDYLKLIDLDMDRGIEVGLNSSQSHVLKNTDRKAGELDPPKSKSVIEDLINALNKWQ